MSLDEALTNREYLFVVLNLVDDWAFQLPLRSGM